MSIKKILLNNKLFFILLFFTALINSYFLTLPLLKDFNYEFAAINSIIFFVTVPILVFHNNQTNKKSFYKLSQLNCLVLFPLIVVFVNFFFIVSPCELLSGLYFYLIISLVSGYIAFFLSEIIYFLSSKRAYLLLILSLTILIIFPLLELYLYPQIYFYSPMIAFFPGSIYDEDISISLNLIIYRIINLAFILSFYFLVKKRIIVNKKLLTIIIVIVLIISFLISPILGFSTDENRLEKTLSEKIENDNFIIYHNSLDLSEQKVLLLHLNYYYLELKKIIRTTPSKKIKVFIFKDDIDKKKYFGSENADIAKPWLYQIYLDKVSWRSTLKHELVHIFSAEFGSTILKLAGNLSPFLIEGFATAIDPYVDMIDIDYLTGLNYKISNENLISTLSNEFNFFRFNSLTSYLFSGSFCKYLIDSYGIEKFKQFYSSNNFEKVYNKDFQTVTKNYFDHLNNLSIEINHNVYNYYFVRKALIQKDCPRYIERKIKEGWELYQTNNFVDSKRIFKDILKNSDNYSAVMGLTECLIKQDSLSNAISLLSNNIKKFTETPYEFLLLFRLADILVLAGKNEDAMKIYLKIENDKPNLNLSTLSNFRLKLLQDRLLLTYLSSNDSVKLKIILELNKDNYVYSSIPSMIIISKNLKINYHDFLSYFNKPFVRFDEYSFYAFLKLSQFMVDNCDFSNARKIAALSKRSKSDDFFANYINDNYKIIEWFYFNSGNF